MAEPTKRPKKLDADLLTHKEIEQLLATCSKRAPSGVRNAAMIALLWRCGLRISECLALRVKDVDLDKGTIVVQHGKGDKRRVVGLDAGTAAMVQRWLTFRTKRSIGHSAPLLCTLDGGKMDTSYVRHLMPRLARKAGIDKRVHAHGLRHAFAIDLVNEGATMVVLRDLLGHSSVAVSNTYLQRIGTGEAIRFARSRLWENGSR